MDLWPSLPYPEWKDTFETLRLWLQAVGKVRLVQSPWVNHQWHVALYVTARGLTTSPIPHGTRVFQIDFDFIEHRLAIASCDGGRRGFGLEPQPVCVFYRRLFSLLAELDLPVTINRKPNELAEAIPFDEDDVHRSYDAGYANRFWRALVQADRVFKIFRGRFAGKCSPVHFFWGSGDLAVSRFSGRRAPAHPGGAPNMPDALLREAYSHECSSCGFWPGGDNAPYPFFFSYAYPAPAGFAQAPVRPNVARFDAGLGEFVLPYDAVRESAEPDATLLDFLQSTYEAAANLAGWDRAALELKLPQREG
ncbi:MAG TPA: DUF5996 family protein [Burkholderiales bacterium]|nr:DUF5996 family protein [Burkholderiales bacterium]